MKILVTGADGLLGSNLVRELLHQNHTVNTFVQPHRQKHTLDGLPIHRIEGDLLNKTDIESAVEDCEAVIHVAAITSTWPSRNELVNKVNIDGTQNIINACKKFAVNKLIYVGSASSFGFGTKEIPGNESFPSKSHKYGLDYIDSKYKAQQLVLDAAKNGLPALVVNPTFMFGPYDSLPSSGTMIIAIYNNKVPGYSKGGRNYISVKDVAVGIANALLKGKSGECYIMGNKNYSYKEMFELIANTINSDAPKIQFPDTAIKIVGLTNNIYGKLRNKKPTITYQMACIACDEHYYSAQKAIQELSLPQTPIEIAIEEAFTWFQQNNFLTINSKQKTKNYA